MPILLPAVMRKNDSERLGLTFSQMKKAARRMERRCDGWLQEDAEAYCLQHSDITGESAVRNVMAENAARRITERQAA